MKPLFFLLLLLSLALGCGKQEEQPPPQPPPAPVGQTPFGSVDEVTTYLVEINPYIQEIGQIQAEVDQMQGSSGQSTSQNLATVMEKVRPRLQQALDDFTQIVPPRQLSSFHADIRKLMTIRLQAYDLTIDGWKKEQQHNDTGWHREAEAQLQQANDLILQLNQQMEKINLSLEQAPASPVQVASP